MAKAEYSIHQLCDARPRMRNLITRAFVKNIRGSRKVQLWLKRIRTMYPPNVDSVKGNMGKSVNVKYTGVPVMYSLSSSNVICTAVTVYRVH